MTEQEIDKLMAILYEEIPFFRGTPEAEIVRKSIVQSQFTCEQMILIFRLLWMFVRSVPDIPRSVNLLENIERHFPKT